MTDVKSKVFSSDFLEEMQSYLATETEGDFCVTRTKLCADLEVDSKLDSVIGTIINIGYMPGFKIWMGPGGGIGRTDRKSSKKLRDVNYALKLSDDDAATILAKLEHLCGGGNVVSRKKMASALGDSGTKMMNLISAALKRPEFSDFGTRNGKGGGIYKVSLRPDLGKKVPRLSTKHSKAVESALAAPTALAG